MRSSTRSSCVMYTCHLRVCEGGNLPCAKRSISYVPPSPACVLTTYKESARVADLCRVLIEPYQSRAMLVLARHSRTSREVVTHVACLHVVLNTSLCVDQEAKKDAGEGGVPV